MISFEEKNDQMHDSSKISTLTIYNSHSSQKMTNKKTKSKKFKLKHKTQYFRRMWNPIV